MIGLDGWFDGLSNWWDGVTDGLGLDVDWPDLLTPTWDWVETVITSAMWAFETVAEVYPVTWEQWTTAGDERVCPECGPLNGMTWPEGEGAVPPLHGNCRCTRGYAFTEWRTRWVEEWRLRWDTRSVWEWSLTGWE